MTDHYRESRTHMLYANPKAADIRSAVTLEAPARTYTNVRPKIHCLRAIE